MTTSNASLFEPGHVGDLTLSNRLVMAPMTRARASDDRVPTPIMGTYYEQRASAGLIVSEGVVVSPMAAGYIKVPGIYSSEQIAAWRAITDRVHAAGGYIFAQIWHVGRMSHPELLDGRLPLAPSGINPNSTAYTRTGRTATVTPKAMSIEEIAGTVSDFRQAALNAVEAGFDGVEIHAANGYLFHQFFAPSANSRTDAYGGSVENRSRLLFEVLDAVSAAIGSRHIGVRLNPAMHDADGIMLDAELERTMDYVFERLNGHDLAYVHLAALPYHPEEEAAEATIAFAQRYRKLYKGTLILNTAMTAEAAIQAIETGMADLVAFGKPFISNPDFARRIRDGLPLTPPDPATFFEGEERGYIDYPFAS